MASFATFDREIRLATAGLTTEAISRELAAFSRAELARVVANGEGNRNFTRFVGGVEGALEDAVVAPGPIVYDFLWWNEIIEAALVELKSRSPKRSGRYIGSFVVLANRRLVTRFDAIPGGAEVVIFNAQPYTRKVEVGAMQMTVPPFHFDASCAALRRRFGTRGAFSIVPRFLNLGAGADIRVPYLLKGQHAKLRAQQLASAKAGTLRAGAKRLHRRAELDAGQPISYPAIVINMVH